MHIAEFIGDLADAEKRLNHLRRWAFKETGFGHPVRTEAGRVALSALLRRFHTFGLETSIESMSAEDLVQAVALTGGAFSTQLARVTLSRAFVENNERLIAAYGEAKVEPEMIAWFVDRDQAGPARARELIDSIYVDREELHVTRLYICRRHPDLIEPSWWLEIPADLRLVAHYLARIAARRSDLCLPLANFLAERRDVLLADDPDAILAPLVTAAGTSPQTLLAPFVGIYGESTVLAAAAWHLEHGQPESALLLAGQIRPLSQLAERALLVSGLAACETGDLAQARAIRRLSEDSSIQDQLDLRLAQVDNQVPAEEIADIARRCRRDQPERFLACLTLLLERRALTLTRTVAQGRSADFQTHPVLGQIYAVLGLTAAAG